MTFDRLITSIKNKYHKYQNAVLQSTSKSGADWRYLAPGAKLHFGFRQSPRRESGALPGTILQFKCLRCIGLVGKALDS